MEAPFSCCDVNLGVSSNRLLVCEQTFNRDRQGSTGAFPAPAVQAKQLWGRRFFMLEIRLHEYAY